MYFIHVSGGIHNKMFINSKYIHILEKVLSIHLHGGENIS